MRVGSAIFGEPKPGMIEDDEKEDPEWSRPPGPCPLTQRRPNVMSGTSFVRR